MLSENFLILQFCGIWRPILWYSGWKKILYNSYTVLILFLIFLIMITELVNLFSSFDTIEEFVNGSFMLFTVICVCGKTGNMLMRRSEIIELTKSLNEDQCIPRGPEEVQIRTRCDNEAR